MPESSLLVEREREEERAVAYDLVNTAVLVNNRIVGTLCNCIKGIWGSHRRSTTMAAIEDPRGVPPNYIIGALPPDLLKMTFRALPASNRFVSPVCRHFRDLYGAAVKDKEKTNRTYEYSIATEAALELYLEEAECGGSRNSSRTSSYQTSMIGAGCGRTDWVERGGVFDKKTCRAAAAGGQLRVLQWLRGRGCPWNSETCSAAARNGHLKVLQWAREEGCEWDRDTCHGAALGGHLEVLQWARGEGCEWNSSTCAGAAGNGHLEVLKWAWVNGCKWDSSTCFNAAYGGHLRVLKAAIRNGCPYKEHDFETYISDPDFHEWFGEYKANNSN